MARRYDSRTTIFSPEGRLYQVEYAMEAISNAGASIGMLAKDGVVLVAEKKITSKVSSGRSRECARVGGLACGKPWRPVGASPCTDAPAGGMLMMQATCVHALNCSACSLGGPGLRAYVQRRQICEDPHAK